MAEYPDYESNDVVRTPSQEGHINVAEAVDDASELKAAYISGAVDKDIKVDNVLSDYAAEGGFAGPGDIPVIPDPELPTFPTAAGDYNIKCTVDAEGKAVLTWEAIASES